ncbi:hypothetical protein GN956_G25246 [Arapaima gigas]
MFVMDLGSNFAQWKKQCVAKVDLSKKGSIDEDICDVVRFINLSENFFTTSSCSGRIILIDGVSDCEDVQKQNSSWLFVTHQMCNKTDVISALKRSQGDAVFKFEPFVLHVQCKRLQDAQLLAVRSTHCLEVPLSHKGQLLVEDHYIDFLVEVANQKMQENFRRIKRFDDCLKSAIHPEELHSELPDFADKKPIYKQRRKRTQDSSQAAVCLNNKENASSDECDGLDYGLSLFK